MENKLKSILAERGMTQIELCERAGLKLETIRAKMCGRNPFTFYEVAKICEALKIENPLGVFEVR